MRCIKSDGTMAGVMPTRDALRLAQQEELDLVEISPNEKPPVCRIMDFVKYRYDESIKRKLSRKQSRLHNRSVKEIRFHANVGENDYRIKINHIRKFLEQGHKVKLSLQFRGRERAHQELGFELMNHAIKDCENICTVDMAPRMIGRNIVSMLGARSIKTSKK